MTATKVLEVVYSFPLPHQAVLLGFATELNGERHGGRHHRRSSKPRASTKKRLRRATHR